MRRRNVAFVIQKYDGSPFSVSRTNEVRGPHVMPRLEPTNGRSLLQATVMHDLLTMQRQDTGALRGWRRLSVLIVEVGDDK